MATAKGPTSSLRVAVVTETYPPDINGVAMTMGRLVDGLIAAGHRVDLIRAQVEPGEPASESPHLEVTPVKALTLPWYPEVRVGMPSTSMLIDRWRKTPPDIVHVVTEGPLGWSALRAAVRLRIPCCSDFHTNFHSYSTHYGVGLLKRPLTAYLRRFHNRSHCTMVPTAATARELAGVGYRNLAVVSRGVDTVLFDPARRCHPLRAQWGLAADQTAVVHVGRLSLEKNLPLLFRAFSAMRAIQPNARLILVGGGPLRAQLQAAHPDAVFAGMQTGEALARHYASGDIFVFPSSTETYGNVTAEAMASGLAVLAYDYAAAREHIVDGVNGAVATLGDEAAFIDRGCRMVADTAQLAACRGAARHTAEKLSWQRVVVSLIDVYRSVLKQSARRSLVAGVDVDMPGRLEAG